MDDLFAANNRRYLITRTVSYDDRESWGPHVDVIAEAGYFNAITERLPSWLHPLAYKWLPIQFALKLLRISRPYSGVAVGRYGLWFPVFCRLLRRPIKVVLTDQEWREHESGWMNHWAAVTSDAVCCNTRAEIERYSKHFNVSQDKFVLVPLAFQKRDLRLTSDEGYIFAGGTQGRDWNTLFRAVEGLKYPVRIYTLREFNHLPSNVTAISTDREGYYTAMAAASCVVVPLKPEPMRITGTTTFTAAMGMGKVVLVTEPWGAPDYMEQGVSGFYVDYGDANTLRNYIIEVMENSALRLQIGEAARLRALTDFSPEAYRKRVLELLRG